MVIIVEYVVKVTISLYAFDTWKGIKTKIVVWSLKDKT